jgi:hypothetical protein
MGLCTFDAEGNAVEDENGACYEGGFGGSVTVTASPLPDVMPIFLSLPNLLSDSQQPMQTAPPSAVTEAGMTAQPPKNQSPLSPQTPTTQQPQKKPCAPLVNNLRGRPAAGVDTLLDVFSRIMHPLEMIELNGIMLVTGGITAVAGGTAVAITCGVPEPFEPLTCAVGVAGGVPTAAGGTFLVKQSISFFKNNTLPAIKDWGCHE